MSTNRLLPLFLILILLTAACGGQVAELAIDEVAQQTNIETVAQVEVVDAATNTPQPPTPSPVPLPTETTTPTEVPTDLPAPTTAPTDAPTPLPSTAEPIVDIEKPKLIKFYTDT